MFFLFEIILKEFSHDVLMGIEDPKNRLFVFLLINLIVILAFRYWVLNNDSFVLLLNGLPSLIGLEIFDPAF